MEQEFFEAAANCFVFASELQTRWLRLIVENGFRGKVLANSCFFDTGNGIRDCRCDSIIHLTSDNVLGLKVAWVTEVSILNLIWTDLNRMKWVASTIQKKSLNGCTLNTYVFGIRKKRIEEGRKKKGHTFMTKCFKRLNESSIQPEQKITFYYQIYNRQIKFSFNPNYTS